MDHHTKVSIMRDKNTDRVNTGGQIKVGTKESGKTMLFPAKVEMY